MRQIIEVLRLKYEAGLSHERIARACGLSKGVVGKYVNLAQAHDVTWPLPEDVDEVGLEALLFPAKTPPARFTEPDYFQVHQELKTKGVTLQLLWAEYVERHSDKAYRYSQFCHHYRLWRGRQRRSMRQVHRAGEKIFIDYCGPTVPVVDRSTGEMRKAQVFVAVLGASSYTFAEATWSQSLPDWIASHQRMLAFYGGVAELLVPDNLKAAVTKPIDIPRRSTRPTPNWPPTTRLPYYRHAPTNPRTRRKLKPPYCWSSAGYWPGYGTGCSSPWPN